MAVPAGASYWGYRQYDAHRAEQPRFDARLAAEEAKRDAQLQAQKLATEEGRRRTQEERTQLEQVRMEARALIGYWVICRPG